MPHYRIRFRRTMTYEIHVPDSRAMAVFQTTQARDRERRGLPIWWNVVAGEAQRRFEAREGAGVYARSTEEMLDRFEVDPGMRIETLALEELTGLDDPLHPDEAESEDPEDEDAPEDHWADEEHASAESLDVAEESLALRPVRQAATATLQGAVFVQSGGVSLVEHAHPLIPPGQAVSFGEWGCPCDRCRTARGG